MELMLARVTALEDLKRAKTNLDARLDHLEDRLTLTTTSVDADRTRIDVLETEIDVRTFEGKDEENEFVMTK